VSLMSCRTRPSPQSRGPCYPVEPLLGDLDSIVSRYIIRHRPEAIRELETFRNQPTLRGCIREAGLARTWDAKKKRWKRLNHQRRIPSDTLRVWANALLRKQTQMSSCKSFETLLSILDKEGRKFWKDGELTVYDTAMRIGAYLNVAPEAIYLHAGTRQGAKALRIDGSRRSIRPDELPEAFRRLKPYEIEGCLCIYKDHLKRLQSF
jgi:hypothetical protein